jgi:hypothetical protein
MIKLVLYFRIISLTVVENMNELRKTGEKGVNTLKKEG